MAQMDIKKRSVLAAIPYPSRDVLECVRQAILQVDREEPQCSYQVVEADNEDAAWKRIKTGEDFYAIVCSADLPRREADPLVVGSLSGVPFLKRLRQEGINQPVAVLYSALVGDNKVSAALSKIEPKPSQFREGEDLQVCLRDFIKGTQPSTSVELSLVERKGGDEQWDWDWNVAVKGIPNFKQKSGSFRLSRARVGRFTDERRLKRFLENEWIDAARDYGDEMALELVRENHELWECLKVAIAKAGGVERSRVRFVVKSEEVHNAFFESILEPEEGRQQEFWALKAPICRRFKVDPLEDLFDESVNVLLLGAQLGIGKKKFPLPLADDDGNPIKISVDDADDDIHAECSGIYEALDRERSTIELAELWPPREDRQPLSWTKVKSLLQERNWDIVHYSGHSFVHEASGEGYLLWPGSTHPVAVSVPEFCKALADSQTKLVFLNSCESAGRSFLRWFEHRGIPAVIGYRCRVGSAAASNYAMTFYRELLRRGAMKPNSIEDAFFQARRNSYTTHPQDRTWLAATLTLQ